MAHTEAATRSFRAPAPKLTREETRSLRKPDPALGGLPAAFASWLRRFPCPPDWSRHPHRSEAALEMVAVVSHRPPLFAHTLANFCAILPGAALTIVHGPDNAEWVRTDLLSGWSPGRHEGVRAVQRLQAGPFTNREYNLLLTSAAFWEDFAGAPRVLIFQPDTLLLRNTALDFIAETYVGAPWVCSWHEGTLPGEKETAAAQPCRVGNGGLSLRDPRLMARLCALPEMEHLRSRPEGPVNEDIAFARLAAAHSAHPLRAQRFSVETLPFAVPMGLHKPWLHLRATQLKEILTCAPPPPDREAAVPRLWEREWQLLAAERPIPLTSAPPADPERIREATQDWKRIDLSPEEQARMRAWVRLGTNYRGFFVDEGATVPLPPRVIHCPSPFGLGQSGGCRRPSGSASFQELGARGGDAAGRGSGDAAAAIHRWAFVLRMAETDHSPALAIPLTQHGLCLQRVWVA